MRNNRTSLSRPPPSPPRRPRIFWLREVGVRGRLRRIRMDSDKYIGGTTTNYGPFVQPHLNAHMQGRGYKCHRRSQKSHLQYGPYSNEIFLCNRQCAPSEKRRLMEHIKFRSLSCHQLLILRRFR